MAKRGKNYLNNTDLLEEIIKCKNIEKKFSKKEKQEGKIHISDKLTEYMYKLANKISSSRNFINYTYKDEMIQESVVHALYKAYPNYNIERTNPFSFFSTVIIYKFIEMIKKEKKIGELKDKMKLKEIERIHTANDERL